METFTTTTLLTKKEFTNYLYQDLYKKPYYIAVSLFGAYLFVSGIYYIAAYPELDTYELLRIAAGIFLLLIPTINILIAVRNSFSNPALQSPIFYTFSDDTINIKAATAEATIKWVHVIKVKETSAFVVLFVGKKAVHLVNKDSLSKDQIDFIKERVKVS